MIQSPGDIGKDASNTTNSTDSMGSPKGGSSPIETAGEVGKDNMGFSPNTNDHNPSMPVPKGGSIITPADI